MLQHARPQPLDWDDLRILLAVSRAGSLLEAAKALHVDRATVMRRIDALEARLGAHLVQRSRDGCSLTERGASVVDDLQAIEDRVGAVRAAVVDTDEALDGVVRITLPEWLAYTLLAPNLFALRASHPQLRVEILSTNQLVRMTGPEADIAIRNVAPEQATLVVRRLRDFAFGLYATPAYWAAARGRDWAERDVITYDGSMAYMPGFRWLAERVPADRVALRVSETLPMLAAAQSGIGIAVLPCALGDGDPKLTRVPPGVVSRFDVWLVTRRELLRQRRVRVTLDFLAELFKTHASRLSGRPAAKRSRGRSAKT